MLRSTKPPKCKVCRVRLEQCRPGQVVHEGCVEAYVDTLRAKKLQAAKKQERAQIRVRKQALETPKKLLPKAQRQVNRWCRFRDLLAGRGCISCGATFRSAFGGAFDAGHFRSVGSAGHLRFFTKQIRLQCVHCNRDLSGNATEFRKGMVGLFGTAEVECIESMYWTANWTVDYLRRLIRVATKRANRLEKRYAMQG